MGSLERRSFFIKSAPHRQDGQGNEVHEGNAEESHAREQDCEGQEREVCGVPWQQGKDQDRLEEGRSDEELPWQDCEPQGRRRRQEELREHSVLDPGLSEGTKSSEPEGICGRQWKIPTGQGPLRKGKVLLLELSVEPCTQDRRLCAKALVLLTFDAIECPKARSFSSPESSSCEDSH